MEKEGIPKLEKGCKDNKDLLEYVNEAACFLFLNCDGPFEGDIGPSWVDHTFEEYYLRGEIDTSMETAYLEHENVQNTLEAFGLDRNKFWYLCLMIKDVVRGYTEDAHPHAPNPREELTALANEILKMEHEVHDDTYPALAGRWKSCKNAAELTLQVKEEGNKKNEKFTITGKKTLWFLGMAVYQFLKEYPEHCELDSITGMDEVFRYEKTSEKEIWKVAFFHKYMKWFLEKHLEGKTVKKKIMRDEIWSDGVKIKLPQPIPVFVDTSKQNLIARLIYILGISKKDGYKNATGLLHNNLYGEYINPTPKNHNSRYFISLTSLEM